MNESLYDEDLVENEFFKKLKTDFNHLIDQATVENWIICVPKIGSFDVDTITEEDYYFHILTYDEELPENHYRTLKGSRVTISDRIIRINDSQDRINILFEETFYTDNLLKYKVWCIESSLNRKGRKANDQNCIHTVFTLRDCIDFLWSESLEKNILEQLNTIINDFLIKNSTLHKHDLDTQKQLVNTLYKECLQVALCDKKLSDSISLNKFQINNLNVCIEAYIQHSIYKELMNGISGYTGEEDAAFNKIVRNLCDTQLSHLNIRSDINDSIPCAKQHLAKINSFNTIIDKINCLRNTVTEVTISIKSRKTISVDDLIPVFTFLILKTCVPNWITNLVFLKHFQCSNLSLGDEANFLITTLEAAIEFIKSGILSTPSEKQFDSNDLNHLLEQIRLGNYDTIKRILNENSNLKNEFETKSKELCHPLCSCDKCETILSKMINHTTPTVHSSDDKGYTPLHIACMYGKPKIVELLLEYGADIHRYDYSGASPLHYAALRGHQNALLLLLHSGADINAVDTERNTPLHFACNNGHDACVKALLYFAEHQSNYINVNGCNISGDTPLHYASKWGYKLIVQILLEYGADPNIENNIKKTPYDYAHNYNISQMILQAKYTNKKTEIQTINRKGQENLECSFVGEWGVKPTSPNDKKKADLLLRAVAYGDLPMICYYLGLQIPNGHNNEEALLCHPLCDCEKCRVIQDDYTISVGDKQNVNVCNCEGYTALHIASLHGQTDIVGLLLDNGAAPNVTTRKGLTPLHLACQTGRLEIVRLLIQKGCRVNVQDVKGNTALHYACCARDARIVEVLIQNKADINVKNLKGVSAFEETEWKTIAKDVEKS